MAKTRERIKVEVKIKDHTGVHTKTKRVWAYSIE